MRRRNPVPPNAHTIFSFQLPYAIPVQDGMYNLKLGMDIAEIKITRVQRTDIKWSASPGSFIQYQNDKYGRSSFSAIEMKIPRFLSLREDGRTPIFVNAPPRRRAKEILLRFLNRFINCVKVTTQEYWVESARYQDIESFNISYWDGSKHIPGSQVIIDTGVGGVGIHSDHPFKMEEASRIELITLLENEEQLESNEILLLNSKDACLQENYRIAIIEAVAALEVVLYGLIRQKGEEKGIDSERIDRFIINVGLTGNITVVMRLLVDDISEVDDILSVCQGAIKIRNKILHEGFHDLVPRESEERVRAIEQMIEFIKKQ